VDWREVLNLVVNLGLLIRVVKPGERVYSSKWFDERLRDLKEPSEQSDVEPGERTTSTELNGNFGRKRVVMNPLAFRFGDVWPFESKEML
jgi:hypothetical protein